MRYLSIKTFSKYQHYKDRRPPWIKLHVEVLDDYAFTCLQDASKAHLMLLWVLASKMDNRIPYDLAFLSRKLGATSPVDLEELVLQGFIEVSQDDGKALAPRKQSAMPETEGETEAEGESETDSGSSGDEPPVIKKIQRYPPPSKIGTPDYPLYPPEFEAAWEHYPRRPNNPKKDAYRAWRTRVTQKEASPDELVEATKRYNGYCRKRKLIGTDTVKRGSTFYGPHEHWREQYEAAAVNDVDVVDGWFAA